VANTCDKLVIKPFTMAFLGWLFFKVLFAELGDLQLQRNTSRDDITWPLHLVQLWYLVWESNGPREDANYTLVAVSH